MKGFLQVEAQQAQCHICSEWVEKARSAYLVVQEDSLGILCERCGDFFFSVLYDMMGVFASGLRKETEEKKKKILEGERDAERKHN